MITRRSFMVSLGSCAAAVAGLVSGLGTRALEAPAPAEAESISGPMYLPLVTSAPETLAFTGQGQTIYGDWQSTASVSPFTYMQATWPTLSSCPRAPTTTA